MHDGRVVVVKVQRPGIREIVAEDMEVLEEIAGFLDKHTQWGKRYEFGKMLEEVRRSLWLELDYRLLAALIIGAALLARVETSFRIFGYPGFAILCFLGVGGGGLFL